MKLEIHAYCDSLCEPQNGRLGNGPMDVGYWAKLKNDSFVLFMVSEIIRNDHNDVIPGTCNQAEYYGLLRVHERVVLWLKEIRMELPDYLNSAKATYVKNPKRNPSGHVIPWSLDHESAATAYWRKATQYAKQIDEHGMELTIHSDSQLMVRQLDGEPYRAEGQKAWKVKHPDIKRLFDVAVGLQKVLSFSLHKLDRHQNGIADSLAQNRVLKGSAKSKQLEDKYYSVKKHTPCSEFIQGRDSFTLLQSDLPRLKDKLIRAIDREDEPEYIIELLQTMRNTAKTLKTTLPNINAKVDGWLEQTFSKLDTELDSFITSIGNEDYDTAKNDIIEFFVALSKPIYVDDADLKDEELKDVSLVSDEFLCPRLQNKHKKDKFESIPELDSMESQRGNIYIDRQFFEGTFEDHQEELAWGAGDDEGYSD